MPNPILKSRAWRGEVELQGGEIHDFYADLYIEFTYDGNSYSYGSYKIHVREKIKINGEEIEIKLDFTDRVPHYVVDKLFEEYIVNDDPYEGQLPFEL